MDGDTTPADKHCLSRPQLGNRTHRYKNRCCVRCYTCDVCVQMLCQVMQMLSHVLQMWCQVSQMSCLCPDVESGDVLLCGCPGCRKLLSGQFHWSLCGSSLSAQHHLWSSLGCPTKTCPRLVRLTRAHTHTHSYTHAR